MGMRLRLREQNHSQSRSFTLQTDNILWMSAEANAPYSRADTWRQKDSALWDLVRHEKPLFEPEKQVI